MSNRALIALCVILVTSGCGRQWNGKPNVEREEDLNDNPEARAAWFNFVRSYPFSDVPRDARRAAWESAHSTGYDLLAPLSQSWTSIGPSPTIPYFPNRGASSGRINAVAVSPRNTQIVLVGASTGGIWRSVDGGATFVPVSDDQVDMAVGSIAFSKSNSDIVYAGMGDSHTGVYLGTGVLKSTDAGVTWRRVSNSSLPVPGSTFKIEVDSRNADRVYLAQRNYLSGNSTAAAGFYVSADGGINWSRKISGRARDVVVHPTNPNILYVTMSRVDSGGSAGLFQSNDAGETFTQIYRSPADGITLDIRVAVSSSDPSTIYIYTGDIIGNSTDYRVLVSTNTGATWTSLGATFDTAQFGYNTYIAVDPTDPKTVYIGSRDIFKSTDGGATWKNLTNNYTFRGSNWIYSYDRANLHTDQHCIAFSPSDPRTIYVGNDGGLWKSTDGATTFSPLNATLSLTQFYSITVHPLDAGLFFGGAQDNSTQRRIGWELQWKELTTGDGGPTVIDAVDPNYIFTIVTGDILRSSDRGLTIDADVGSPRRFGEPPNNPRIAFTPPLSGNGVDSTLYFGTWRLFVSSDRGQNWQSPAASTDLTKGPNADAGPDVLSSIAVARSNPKVIYTGSEQGRVMVSTDAGQTWSDITAGLPNRSISGIVVDSLNSSLVYVTFYGYLAGHIFRSSDGGASWTNISSNLPDIPVDALLIDPRNPDLLYAGTDIGVFRSNGGGDTWTSFNQGLPPVIVTSFAAQPNGLIRIGTYGRGAYELSKGEFDAVVGASQGLSRVSNGIGPLKVAFGELSGTLAQPSALANVSLTENGVLVSEVGVPAVSMVKNARIFVDYATGTNSGVALVNPGSSPISVSVVLRDASGKNAGTSTLEIPGGSQIARFVDEMMPGISTPFLGTLTLSSSGPFAAVNLSSAVNGHGETIFSAMSVADLDQVPKDTTLVFPQIADGGGIETEILLMNPSASSSSSGKVYLYDDQGAPMAVDFAPASGPQAVFDYSIPASGMMKLVSRNAGATRVGYAVLTATSGPPPIGSGIFTVLRAGGIVSQAGVPAAPKTASSRIFVDVASAPLQRNTGIAIVNPNSVQATINLTLTGTDGTGLNGTIQIAPNGHAAKFMDQLVSGLPPDFQGVLTLTSSVPVSPLTLRLTTNQRGDSIYSTLPVADLNNRPAGPLIIPQVVDGGGYRTQIIVVNTANASGTLHIDFFDQNGNKLTLN